MATSSNFLYKLFTCCYYVLVINTTLPGDDFYTYSKDKETEIHNNEIVNKISQN